MSLADQVLAVNDDLPIRTDKPVHFRQSAQRLLVDPWQTVPGSFGRKAMMCRPIRPWPSW